jgi:glycosyltransferase 2 family protein
MVAQADPTSARPATLRRVAPPATAPRRRGALFFGLKVVLAAALIGWLVRSGGLDFGKLHVLWDSPLLFGANLLAWLICSAMLSTIRWRLLLGLADVKLGLFRAMQLQVMALFLNVAIPGNVGGDVVKALYVADQNPKERRAAILLVVLVERLLGLIGLVAVGVSATALGGPALWHSATMKPTVTATWVLGAAFLVGPLVGVAALRRWGGLLRRWTRGESAVLRLGDRVVAAAQMLVSKPAILAGGLLLSMGMHAVAMGYFTLLTQAITDQPAQYGAIATVFPIGLLTVVLPVSPAGIGVGHLAFDRLYEMIGLTGGATIFNVFLIGQIAPSLLGIVPFLMLRRRLTLTAAEIAPATAPALAPTPAPAAPPKP